MGPPKANDYDVGHAFHLVGWALFGISLISVGIHETLLHTLEEHGRHEFLRLEVFETTFPLTAAIAFIGWGLVRGLFPKWWTFLLSLTGALMVTSYLATLLEPGRDIAPLEAWTGLLDPATLPQLFGSSPLSIPLNILFFALNSFLYMYGFWTFISALLVSGLLAWLLGEKGWALVRRGETRASTGRGRIHLGAFLGGLGLFALIWSQVAENPPNDEALRTLVAETRAKQSSGPANMLSDYPSIGAPKRKPRPRYGIVDDDPRLLSPKLGWYWVVGVTISTKAAPPPEDVHEFRLFKSEGGWQTSFMK